MDQSKKRSERRRLPKKIDRCFAAVNNSAENNSENDMDVDEFLPTTSEIISEPSYEIASEPDLEDLYSNDDFLTDISSEDSDIFNTETAEIEINSSLATWAVKYGLSRDALNDLLSILGSAGLVLPKDSRTLLKTLSFSNDNNKKSSYSYLGIFDSLQNVIDSPPKCSVIELIVNIDGLPMEAEKCQSYMFINL